MAELRPDPEALLRQAEAADRGTLKVLLGYAPGVGKSFRLFDEGRRRRERGEDVVVGAVDSDLAEEVQNVVRQLESVPMLQSGAGSAVAVDAILRRRPAVCLVDNLARDNAPGSPRGKRYEDVAALIAAGISVLTSINLEEIEEQQPFIEGLLGRRAAETVPEAFIDGADEIVVVDAPEDPSAGDAAEPQAHALSALRERALLLVADAVQRQLDEYLRANRVDSSWGTQERILVCMTPRANAAAMLASGRRNADRFHGDLLAVYVNQPNLTAEDRSALARNVMLARAQHAEVAILDGHDPIGAILDFARQRNVTQLYVGHNLRRTWRTQLTGSLLDSLIRRAEGLDVRVFPH
jgi:two-component system, OmpR family, sensor histidine kinase KdpD